MLRESIRVRELAERQFTLSGQVPPPNLDELNAESAGSLTIYGGEVTAEGENGIGGGTIMEAKLGGAPNIQDWFNLLEGLAAKGRTDGGSLTVYGGMVKANGRPAIGPGRNDSQTGISQSPTPAKETAITFHGGTIIQNGQTTHSDSENILTISPAGGAYEGDKLKVAITCETPDAKIYYTTDGTNPSQNSTLYTGEFEITLLRR